MTYSASCPSAILSFILLYHLPPCLALLLKLLLFLHITLYSTFSFFSMFPDFLKVLFLNFLYIYHFPWLSYAFFVLSSCSEIFNSTFYNHLKSFISDVFLWHPKLFIYSFISVCIFFSYSISLLISVFISWNVFF